jgi:hypothetical protein
MQVDETRKRGLGRGLDALIPLEAQIGEDDKNRIINVGVDEISPNPLQPRRRLKSRRLKNCLNQSKRMESSSHL